MLTQVVVLGQLAALL